MQRPHLDDPQRRVVAGESNPFPGGRMIGPVSGPRFEGEAMASGLQYPIQAFP